jgi:hypothetical protein
MRTRCWVSLLIGIFSCPLSCPVLAQSTQSAQITKTFIAIEHDSPWDGWAKSERSIPGWRNKPPEPGTVKIIAAASGQSRTFSGRVDGLESTAGAQVGVVSLTYIYWILSDTYHWMPLAKDGTFSITEDKYPVENKAVILRAPGHPWTFFSYIFKGNEGGKDILLHADPGKNVPVTVEVAGTPSRNFGVEFFALNKSWIHENNPLGYQWASRDGTPDNSDGNLTLCFPLHPIAVYVWADGGASDGASDWEIVDARDADQFHFILLPAARVNLTVTRGGLAAAGIDVLMGNDDAALSLRSGATDSAGKWSAGRLPPGTWWLKIGKNTAEFDLDSKQTLNATYELGNGELSTGP